VVAIGTKEDTKLQKIKPYVLNNKLVLRAGTHNGVNYSEEEVRKLFNLYKAIEAKPFSQRTIEEVHAFDLQRGGDEDHKDSSGTWVGDVSGVYWDEAQKGFGFKKFNIVEEGFATKIEYQKNRGKASFGISPRLNVLRVGTEATNLIPKNVSVVLTPAGGEPLMLSKDESKDDGREIRQDFFIQDITLSEMESVDSTQEKEGDKKMSEDVKALLSRIENLEKAREERETQELNSKIAALSKTLEETQKLNAEKEKEYEAKLKQIELEKEEALKAKEDEKLAAKKMAEGEKMPDAKTELKKDEKMVDGKANPFGKKEDEKMSDDDNKGKYYGAKLSVKDGLTKDLNIVPDITRLDEVSITRVGEDISNATKIFDGEYTLEQAHKGITELHAILSNLPNNVKEEKALMERVEETLSASIEKFSVKMSDRTQTEKKTTDNPIRKGLILGNAFDQRTEETLGQKNVEKNNGPVSKQDLKNELAADLSSALGL